MYQFKRAKYTSDSEFSNIYYLDLSKLPAPYATGEMLIVALTSLLDRFQSPLCYWHTARPSKSLSFTTVFFGNQSIHSITALFNEVNFISTAYDIGVIWNQTIRT